MGNCVVAMEHSLTYETSARVDVLERKPANMRNTRYNPGRSRVAHLSGQELSDPPTIRKFRLPHGEALGMSFDLLLQIYGEKYFSYDFKYLISTMCG